jgi:hypothetical protein
MRMFRLALSVVLVLVAGALPALSQLESGLGASSHSGASNAAYYFISKPGEITMSINLWGYVRNPGRYEVPISTDLIQLLSYAGGPLADANLSNVKISRVVRREEAIRIVEYTVSLDRLDKLDEKARDLEPGDTIFIETPPFSWKDVFSIVTTAAIVTSAIASVIIATKTF